MAGQPGALLSGDQPAGRSARLVVVLGSQLLFAAVDVNGGLGVEGPPLRVQRDLVTRVADAAGALV